MWAQGNYILLDVRVVRRVVVCHIMVNFLPQKMRLSALKRDILVVAKGVSRIEKQGKY